MAPRTAVAHSKEAHESARFAASAELLIFSSDLGEVRTNTGAVLEDSSFPCPEVHDPSVVNEVVLHAQNETSVGLGSLVGVSRLGQLAGGGVDIRVSLS